MLFKSCTITAAMLVMAGGVKGLPAAGSSTTTTDAAVPSSTVAASSGPPDIVFDGENFYMRLHNTGDPVAAPADDELEPDLSKRSPKDPTKPITYKWWQTQGATGYSLGSPKVPYINYVALSNAITPMKRDVPAEWMSHSGQGDDHSGDAHNIPNFVPEHHGAPPANMGGYPAGRPMAG